ncbi:MAG: 1-phosphofructokinase family hexose kinase [Thermoleophilia bacterium]
MIVTLTLNPSVDRTIEVDALQRGGVLRASGGRVDPGGKGVNVSRALVANGQSTRAVVPLGGVEGVQLAALLDAAEVAVIPIAIHGSVRANVAIVEPDGTVTKLNERGPELSASEVEAALAATTLAAAEARWFALCGSLPPGVPDDIYAQLTERLHLAGVQVAVDSSGEALAAALGAQPDLVKPNREELSQSAAMPVRTLGEAAAAADSLRRRGAGAVLASLGPDGALLVDSTGFLHGEASVRARSAVGAGDALLAGFLAAGGRGRAALVEGLAWGAAAASLPGSRMPVPRDLDHAAVKVHERIDSERKLSERS